MDSGPGAVNYISIDDFLIDCSVREGHTFDSEVTDYPTESGANISDNIRPLPITVEIEGIVTNTPIGLMTAEREFDTKPTNTAYLLLRNIREQRKPVTIITSLRTFENMALKSLSIPKGDHMDDMKFTAVFQQIRTVENKRTIRVSTPIGKGGKGGKGNVTKSPEDFPGRIMLIDKAHNAWWDPDAESWTNSAVYAQTVEVTNTNGVTTTRSLNKGKWHLRRQISPSTGEQVLRPELFRTNTVSNLTPESTAEGVDLQARWFDIFHVKGNVIIAVRREFCVFHDFVIKTPPGVNRESLTSFYK